MELSLVEMSPSPEGDPTPKETPQSAAPVPVVAPAADADHSGLSLVEDENISGPDLDLAVDGETMPVEIELTAFDTRLAPTAPRATPPRPPGATAAIAPAAVDFFLAEAEREYKAGNIDLPLWTRALAQHEGDEASAIAPYLRARATVLKIEQRQRRSSDPGPPVRAAVPARRLVEADDDYVDDVPESGWRSPTLRRYALMALPVVVALAVGGWWMSSTGDDGAAQATIAAAAAQAAETASAAAKRPVRTAKEEDPNVYFAGKVIDLKAAGNWNVLVLFASEWTRKQPDNATAWKELSLGYTNMRQYADALEAGKKAAQLAPNDSLVWRNLAQVHMDQQESEAALQAFERAAALNDLDVYSLVQLGTLNLQLDRLPQARTAFERVLAADPENPEALCGSAAIAQRQGRGKDADAANRQLKGSERSCRGANSATTAVAAATRK